MISKKLSSGHKNISYSKNIPCLLNKLLNMSYVSKTFLKYFQNMERLYNVVWANIMRFRNIFKTKNVSVSTWSSWIIPKKFPWKFNMKNFWLVIKEWMTDFPYRISFLILLERFENSFRIISRSFHGAVINYIWCFDIFFIFGYKF